MDQNKSNLTSRWCVHQFLYNALYSGIFSFAATYLLDKGFSAALIGVLLALSNFTSGVMQPMLAAGADKIQSKIPMLLAAMTTFAFICFAVLPVFNPPIVIFFALYLLGALAFDSMNPLLNALTVFYTGKGYKVNYGAGRGIGSLGAATCSLALGYINSWLGSNWITIAVLVCLALFWLVSIGYPKRKNFDGNETQEIPESITPGISGDDEAASVITFFKRYPQYCMSLLGILFIAMFHAMTENYLIQAFQILGGDSKNVGTALFLATGTSVPLMMVFDRIQAKLKTPKVMMIGALAFTLKAVLFITARNIVMMYAAELLQMVTYGFISPAMMFHAKESTKAADMVKGQAFITASYSIGCGIGNLIGGALISASGVRAMQLSGVLMSLLGTLILFATVLLPAIKKKQQSI